MKKTDDSLTFQHLIRVAFSPKAYTKSHSSYLPLGRDEYFLRIIPKPSRKRAINENAATEAPKVQGLNRVHSYTITAKIGSELSINFDINFHQVRLD